MQEKSWEIKEIPAWVSQKGASALIEEDGVIDVKGASE